MESCLYYPYIHFRNDEWLKVAALYWDRVGRIVPTGYETQDSNTVRELSEGLDLIWNIHPESHMSALDSVAARFLVLLDRNTDTFRRKFGHGSNREAQDDPGQLPTDIQHDSRMRRSLRYHGIAPNGFRYVWHSKVSMQLLDALEDLNLTNPRGDSPSEWVAMHPRLLAVYMTALAQELSQETGLSPLADGNLEYLAGSAKSMDTLASVLLEDVETSFTSRGEQEKAVHVALLAVQAVAPANLENIPTAKIVGLRSRHMTEFLAFQTQLRDLIVELLQLEIQNPAVLQNQLDWLVKNRLETQKKELENAISSSGLEVGSAALSISFAAAPGAMLQLLGAGPVIGTGASIAVGAASWLSTRRERTQAIRHQFPAASFLLRIDSELSPDSLVPSLFRRIRTSVGS